MSATTNTTHSPSLVEIKESTISKIEVSKEDLDNLKRVLQSDKVAPSLKVQIQRKITGTCASCGYIPDYIMTRYYEGLQKIERYCSRCMDKQNKQDKQDKRTEEQQVKVTLTLHGDIF